MTDIDAWIEVVDTQSGSRFTRRCVSSPIRVGRAVLNDVCLRHRAIARVHCEISIGSRSAFFRTHCWFKKSSVDGVRVRRGRSIKLNQGSIIRIGPFELRVACRVRDRRYERERKLTPLVLTRLPEWNGAWDVDRIEEPYAMIEASGPNLLEPNSPRTGTKDHVGSRWISPALEGSFSDELARRPADSPVILSVLDDVDQELTKVADHVARDLQVRERQPK